MSDPTAEEPTQPQWDSTAHGPVRGPVHASYSPPPRYDRAVMPLLDLITRQSLDEDYQHVAERRVQEKTPAVDRSRAPLTVAVVLVFGLLVAVAAVQTSRNAPVDTESKDQLISRINTRRDAVADLQKEIADLRASNTRDDARYGELGHQLSQATKSQRVLLAETGWGPVSGDGVRARIDDAPNGATTGEVRDSDLAGLVNGLWQAGATAIAVNGQRVTTLSALRNSGTVVRINGTSLSPPYTVLALGDEKTLQAKFAQTTSGTRLTSITKTYGMPFSMQNETGLSLPSAPSSTLVLRHARTDRGLMSDKETP